MHYIYEIRNCINDKIYVRKHSPETIAKIKAGVARSGVTKRRKKDSE